MKKLVMGILAHVDAGKTTLSEGMLYISGSIRTMGRVDNRDAHLDTYELERERGITIFSKQAEFVHGDMGISLLDTPGHVDFSTEMERTLQVLDYAILVISGADGIQGHTVTLWKLLEQYNIPVFIFINKMDQNGTDKDDIMTRLRERFLDGCIDFTADDGEIHENAALCDEDTLNEYLNNGFISDDSIRNLIVERKIYPCFFGSALKLDGVKEFMDGLDKYTEFPVYPKEFGAKVFKISRDVQGNRLTYMKITGGTLKVKSQLEYMAAGEKIEEKVNQIRIYSGEKFETLNEAEAGMVCAVTGLTKTKPGDGFGFEKSSADTFLEPVLTYRIILPKNVDAALMLPKLRQLEEEDPKLHIVWDENLKEIQAQIMGEVQIEILKRIIKERFDTDVDFGEGNIVYRETITTVSEGVGHFEPLRHYAEVHLILEPAERGSGINIYTECSEDMLDKNWQRLILTHLMEKEHKGVLTGAAITDINIILAAGKAHIKHTEGGDFRQATYRAVRHGLCMAESVLLEPYYDFRLEIPEQSVGRAMTDIEKMCGTFEPPVTEGGISIITGTAPVSTMRSYQKEVIAYSKGHGRLFTTFKGYDICHNQQQIIEEKGYDFERDLDNPAGSVFCVHGAGFTVSWDKVTEHMAIESQLEKEKIEESKNISAENQNSSSAYAEPVIDLDEIDSIMARTFYANSKAKPAGTKWKRNRSHETERNFVSHREWKQPEKREEYLLVDGYNIIFAWEELNELAKINIDGARGRLTDIMCNYQGVKKCNLILVFDAYRIEGHPTEIIDYHNIHIVYTKEAETADQYIEKFAHANGRKYDITVATSDGLEQIIIRGQGCRLLSAREFKEHVDTWLASIEDKMQDSQIKRKNYLFDNISEETAKQIDGIKNGEEK